MRFLRDNLAAADDQDAVEMYNRADPVRYDNEGLPFSEGADRRLEMLLAIWIDIRRRFIQNKNRRVLQNRPRNRDPLPF